MRKIEKYISFIFVHRSENYLKIKLLHLNKVHNDTMTVQLCVIHGSLVGL